jgi:hypothetical protein
MRGGVEAAVYVFARFPSPQIGRVRIVRPEMIHVLGVGQHFKELHRMCTPSGNVASKLLEHEDGALAAPEGDGMRATSPRGLATAGATPLTER